MNHLVRASTCLVMLSFTQCQAEPDAVELGVIGQAVGPVDVDGTPPSCGEDGTCRINECDDDPDCDGVLPDPDDLPPPATWQLTGPTSPTLISGFAGTHVFTLGTPSSSTQAVYALLSRERSNDPCFVAAGIENLNDETVDVAPQVDVCPGVPTSSTLHADYLDRDAGGADDHTFISGVSVCLNNLNDKVKGISVVGRKLMSNGAVASVASLGSSPRPHCEDWMPWVQCPLGQIATAVDLHFVPDVSPFGGPTPPARSLTGVALHCRAVTP